MSDAEKLADKFSGFITREQAESILEGNLLHELDSQNGGKSAIDVKGLLSILESGKIGPDTDKQFEIKDRIYRIFNPTRTNINGKDVVSRTITLGEEGSTILFNLMGKHSDFIDIGSFERGDTIMADNVILDRDSGDISSSPNTLMRKLNPSKLNVITDYSLIKGDMRKVDIAGRIVEIGAIKYASKLGRTEQIPIAFCTITDSSNRIDVSFLGSCANITTSLRVNRIVKIEFCDIRIKRDKIQVHVNDDSRVLSSNAISAKFAAFKK